MDKLGHYRIDATLGQGAMGVVYRAVDERLDRTVALKVLRLNLSAEERAEYAPRLQQEAKSAARLNHPNIITVYDCGDVDGQTYLAIEYVEGKTLQQLLENGVKISNGRVLKLAGQLFGALAYAHEHEVVHRDIKPANLMLTADGRLKITDFGIAQLPASDLTRAGTLVGSPRYMAPEQIEGKKLDGRADIFAAGIVLYEVLTGVRPFDGEHVATIAYRILHEQPTDIRSLNPEVSPWLAELVMRCLEKDPAKRFQTAREARSALREQANQAKTGAHPELADTNPSAAAPELPAAPEVAATPLRRYAPWAAVATIVLVGGISAAVLLGRGAGKDAAAADAAAAKAMVQTEVLEPPGAPGSLPAKAAMPVIDRTAEQGDSVAATTPAPTTAPATTVPGKPIEVITLSDDGKVKTTATKPKPKPKLGDAMVAEPARVTPVPRREPPPDRGTEEKPRTENRTAADKAACKDGANCAKPAPFKRDR